MSIINDELEEIKSRAFHAESQRRREDQNYYNLLFLKSILKDNMVFLAEEYAFCFVKSNTLSTTDGANNAENNKQLEFLEVHVDGRYVCHS